MIARRTTASSIKYVRLPLETLVVLIIAVFIIGFAVGGAWTRHTNKANVTQVPSVTSTNPPVPDPVTGSLTSVYCGSSQVDPGGLVTVNLLAGVKMANSQLANSSLQLSDLEVNQPYIFTLVGNYRIVAIDDSHMTTEPAPDVCGVPQSAPNTVPENPSAVS